MKQMLARPTISVTAWAALMTIAPPACAQSATPAAELPTIDIVQISPLLGSGIDINKVPAAVRTLSGDEISRIRSPSVADVLKRSDSSVTVNDTAGNLYQPDVQFRGFTASPISGTPQGLAVYQNGVRINEAFGDIVNWDFLPTFAIKEINLISNNPVFGLNALGGAISVQMKDGFNYQGFETDMRGGSNGFIMGAMQLGRQSGNFAAYLATETLYDPGWRDYSASSIRRLYGDIGYRGDRAELHLSFTGADNHFGATGPAPTELLAQRYSSVFTTPQTSDNLLGFFNLSGSVQATDTLSIQSNLYYRHYHQSHVDGNTTDVQQCSPPNNLLCFGDGATPAIDSTGRQIPDVSNGRLLGEIDRTVTTTNSGGGSLQVTDVQKIGDHDNHLVVGASYDHGQTEFTANSELGFIAPNFFTSGLGMFIDQPGGGVAPVKVRAINDYVGLYAINTFDVTTDFALTAGARYNFARINLTDQLGGNVNGTNEYSHLNPVLGATYRLNGNMSAYASFAVANRAPTPLELGCADPVNPCILQSFLVSDPHLKQVVSRTIEAGIRGNHDFPDDWGRINWNLGVFKTLNNEDILNVPSVLNGFGYFKNVGSTLRQGIEVHIDYHADKWTAYADYSLIDATFLSTIVLSSPFNPYADAAGNITAHKGNRLPGVPRHQFKTGFDYNITDQWKIGADWILVSSQYLFGDASNLNRPLPGYGIVNAHTSYQVTKNIEIYANVQNMLNKHYYTYGSFFDTASITFLNLKNPRTLSPATPFVAYVGIHATF